ncbi:peptide chain release factor N(5)-glutamine methyltransferase [Exiguobacterium flavidum]|uniref:peptide chain release factor N(5)-glutamine methyltransferase n=1 Tax=Exiguobacterium flavidum TaxID=2184695 RepID=UPI000DF79AAA|nr:peptide chain release factor N(5)-glutamine methyltransferase [Exiguobacterium flavidum]
MRIAKRLNEAQAKFIMAGREGSSAEWLLMHVLGVDRTGLLVRLSDELTPEQDLLYSEYLMAHLNGVPVQHLIGTGPFYGREFEVTPAVLIPRPETEELIEFVVSRIQGETFESGEIVDIGTGSGAICVTLSLELKTPVTTVDISPDAIAVARRNGEQLGADVTFLEGDLLAPLSDESVRVLVSNPPYIEEDELLSEVVFDHEPHLALFGGKDGLDFYRRLVEGSARVLKPDWRLIAFEIGHAQGPDVRLMLKERYPEAETGILKDINGKDRIVYAERKESDMQTEMINEKTMDRAVKLLKDGEVVAIPTETVYGLAGDATRDDAVERIFEAKGRPSDNPLIVHVASIGQAEQFASFVPDVARRLMEAFWPGPLTIILPSSGKASAFVTAGLDTIGLRMPDHPLALRLIEASGLGLAAPSANRSGKPSPTSSGHVAHDLSGRIAGIVDGGETGIGVESTVIDCTATPPVILRPGGVTREQLEAAIGPVVLDPALKTSDAAPKAPGMKYTHYAPEATLSIVVGDLAFLQKTIDAARQSGSKTGVILFDGEEVDADVRCFLGHDMETAARRLYDCLRRFDQTTVDQIFVRDLSEEGVGLAVRNRLHKAAGGRIIRPS